MPAKLKYRTNQGGDKKRKQFLQYFCGSDTGRGSIQGCPSGLYDSLSLPDFLTVLTRAFNHVPIRFLGLTMAPLYPAIGHASNSEMFILELCPRKTLYVV
jgi:hypothetical protein